MTIRSPVESTPKQRAYIRKLRSNLELSRDALSRILDCTADYIRFMENGQRNIQTFYTGCLENELRKRKIPLD